MERGNTKHGPVHDEEMAQETLGMVRGAPRRPHGEEWRETEPVEDAMPPVRRAPGSNPRPEGPEFELRTALARVLTRDFFPADKEAVLARLADADTSPELTERASNLPSGLLFANKRELLVALGISSPESRL